MTFAQPFKDYEILERIGSGAMGTVFKARQKRLDRIVALKVLKPSLARNTKFVERLRREARIVASLNHPDIVAGYDLGDEGGYHFFVMEFVEGKSLATLLKEWGAFPEAQVLDVGIRVASALDHAFKKGVIHRDVKPGNILIDQDGRAKLTDLGLAKAPEDATITQEGATVGTPQYISPEQARDPSKVDVRSDLYSLGATLFHMATGQPPFVGATLANVIHAVVHAKPPLAHTVNPAISEALSAVIRKLLAKHPALRYQTPADLLADLHRVRRAEAPQVDLDALAAAERDAQPGAVRWVRVAVAALLVSLLAMGGVYWAMRRQDATAGSDDQTVAARARAALQATSGWRAKLRLLNQAAADASTDEDRHAVAALRVSVVEPWQRDVERFVRERRAQVDEFVRLPEHWREPSRALRAQILEALERSFDVHRAEMPAGVVQVLDAELARVDGEVGARVADRDAWLLSSYREHLDTVETARWRDALARGDFVAAERAARGLGATFFGAAGRPRREQLPTQSATDIAALEAATLAVALAEIERAEASTCRDLAQAVERGLGSLREQLRGPSDPRAVEAQARVWRAQLLERHPASGAFRAGCDPWPAVRDALLVFDAELQAALTSAEQARLQGDVQLGLAALLGDGDATTELQWLRTRPLAVTAVQAARDAFVAWFEAAHAARDWLLDSLANRAGAKTLAIDDPASPGRVLQVGVRRDGDRLELIERDGARVRKIPLARVRPGDLLAHADPLPARPQVEQGLVIWLYLAGENRAAGDRLAEPLRAFFGEHVAPAIQTALAQRYGDETDARQALLGLQASRAGGAGVLAQALDAFDRRFGRTAVARANAQFLTDLRSEVRDVQQREETAAKLRAGLSRGLRVESIENQRAVLGLDLAALAQAALPPGWSAVADRCAFSGIDLALDAARAQALGLDDRLSTEHGIAVRCDLAFGAQGGRPRAYLFELHGAGVALGLTAAGEPLAAVVPVDDLGRERALQRALEPPLDELVDGKRGLPLVVPGATHQLLLQVRVQAERLSVSVRVDDVEIATGVLPRPTRPVPRLVFTPLQPLAVLAVRVEGMLP